MCCSIHGPGHGHDSSRAVVLCDYTMVLPTEDRYSRPGTDLDDLVYAMGKPRRRRIVFRDPSTAPRTISKASAGTRTLVTEYGMSDRIGNATERGRIRSYTDRYGMGRGSKAPQTNWHPSWMKKFLRSWTQQPAKRGRSSRRIVTSASLQRLLEEETWMKPSFAEIFADVVKQDERPCGTMAKRLPSKVQSWATPSRCPVVTARSLIRIRIPVRLRPNLR